MCAWSPFGLIMVKKNTKYQKIDTDTDTIKVDRIQMTICMKMY